MHWSEVGNGGKIKGNSNGSQGIDREGYEIRKSVTATLECVDRWLIRGWHGIPRDSTLRVGSTVSPVLEAKQDDHFSIQLCKAQETVHQK